VTDLQNSIQIGQIFLVGLVFRLSFGALRA